MQYILGENVAKRLTDTTKWFNPSFRKLPDKYKFLYLYLLDICDNAGVAHLDLDLSKAILGHDFSLDETKLALDARIIFLSSEKIIIRHYIAFQNGDILESNSKIAASIRSLLNSHGLLDRYKAGEFGIVNNAVGLT